MIEFLQKYRNLAIIIALVLSATLLTYFLWGKKAHPEDSISPTDLLTLHPGDSIGWQAIQWSFPDIEKDYAQINQLLELLKIEVESTEALWRITPLGERQYGLALSMRFSKNKIGKSLDALIQKEAVYRGVNVRELQLKDGSRLALAAYRGLLLVGQLPLQVESAIAALKEGSATFSSLETNEALFLLDNLESAANAPLHPYQLDALSQLVPSCEEIRWKASGDPDSLLINGRIHHCSTLLDTITGVEDIFNYLPQSIEWVYSWPIRRGRSKNAAFDNHLSPHLGRHGFTFALPGQQDALHLIQLSGGALSMETSLQALADELGSLSSYQYQLFTVQELLTETLLQPMGLQIKNPHLSLLGDYLLIGSHQAEMQQMLAGQLAGNTLIQNVAFLKTWSQVKTSSLSAWYYHQYSKTAPRSIESPARQLLIKLEGGGALRGLYSRLTGVQNLPNAVLRWTAPLEAEALSGVRCFPDEDVKRICFVQDETLQLYAFDNEGQSVFTLAIGEPILGSIHQVDFFESGKPCFAFNTPERIYLIDKQGRPVGDFPVEIGSRSTTALLAAHFTGGRRYAFYLADTSNRVLGFDQSGHPISHWNSLPPLDSSIHLPLQHVQKNGKDYLLVTTSKGTLYTLDEEGNGHFPPVATNSSISAPAQYQNVNPAGRIVLGDVRGRAHIINLEGAYFRLKISDEPQLFNRLLFLNMVGDDRKDYLAYGKHSMTLRHYEEKDFLLGWTKKTGISVDSAFTLQHQPYEWAGLLDTARQRISIVLPDGSTHPSFPLAGTTPFCIYPSGNEYLNLIVGYGNSLYAYQIIDLND